DEQIMAKLTALPVNAHFAATIEQRVTTRGNLPVKMFGIEAILDPSAAVVSRDIATRFHWKPGDTVRLRAGARKAEFRIRSIDPDEKNEWIAVDIAPAQQLLESYGRIDHVEVIVGPNENADALERAIAGAIPFGYDISTPGARAEDSQRMLRAFRTNLGVLSYISLLVGAFLIYNTIAVSVVRRRVEIGILRGLGVGRRGILAIFLGEAALLGTLGSLAGIGLGRIMASAMVGTISRTVNSIFVTSSPGKVEFAWLPALLAFALGTAVAVVSALIPAREAAGVPPAEAMRREARQHQARVHARRVLAFAGIACAVAIVLGQFGPIGGRPLTGYAAALCAVAAAAFVSPAFVSAAIGLLRGALRRIPGAAGLIAGRSLVASLARTSVVVTALATAIAMTISVGIMVTSFRRTVQIWLQNRLQADIYLRAVGQVTAGVFAPIAPPVYGIVKATPGVEEADAFHAFSFRYQGLQSTFGASDIDIMRRHGPPKFVSGDADAILRSLPNRNRVIVSEPFANKHHVRVGDVLRVALGATRAPLTVAGIYYDYSSHRGLVIADWSTMRKYLPGQPATDIAVYVRKGVNANRVRYDLESRLADYDVSLAPNEALRTSAVVVFDRTFAVTWALEGIALVVAMLGTANSLLALVLDRRREIGLIRCLGADDGQIRRMVLTEAGLIGLLAAGLGLVLGTALSLDLIYVINRQSFGWTIQFHPPLGLMAAALLLLWIFTVAAGIYPARFAARLQPAETAHEE
ncbi:MAG TPA: FtsX-like permease family protein, partial [Bryobacteraceae bacterium]|nr:FtsX-like permease family protein [Bryobacteraceae bacterium]